MPSTRPWRTTQHALLSAITAGLLLSAAGLLPDTGPLAPAAGYASPTAGDLDQQVTAASQQLESVVEQYDSIKVRLGRTQAQRAAAEAAMRPVERQMSALEATIGAYASAAYEDSGGGTLTTLISAGSPQALLDQLSLLQHIGDVSRRQIAALDAQRARYAAQEADLGALIAQENVQQAALAARRASIESQIAALQQKRSTALTEQAPSLHYVPAYVPGPAGAAIRYALAQLGKVYAWGAAGPRAYDCSGLTMAAWSAAGVSLPHSSTMQWSQVAHISRADLRPGDLVFYYSDIHHVAMYLGNGQVVHAPTYGQDVSVAPLDIAPVYGYGRP